MVEAATPIRAETLDFAETVKPVVILVYKCASYQHITIDGTHFIDVRNPDNAELRNDIAGYLANIIGSAKTQGMRQLYPVDELSKVYPRVRGLFKEEYDSEPFGDFDTLFKLLAEKSAAYTEAYEKRKAKGVVEFDDIPLHYAKGTEVISIASRDHIGGIVESVEFYSNFWDGDGWKVKIKVVHTMAGYVMESDYETKIHAFKETVPIDSLRVVPATGPLREALEARGRIFKLVHKPASYVRYIGEMMQNSWSGQQTYRADGRIMVDPLSCLRIDSNRFQEEGRASGMQLGHRQAQTDANGPGLKDEDLWRTYPLVLGFSFRTKKWGTFRVANITPMAWREDAFNYLVMDPEEKAMIKALVSTGGESFQDLVDEKGGGTIFLLEGAPGLGKTLTAETVAEMTHQPLYSISVGELGTDPKTLEATLRTILDIATIWNAVLLLDEADIFLEARDTKDITRNAMVGVFLRLLEYHQGILFLTTNRASNIDPAFLSRISIPLSFGRATPEKMRQIWHNLIQAGKLDGRLSAADVDTLARRDVNGRQVKNALRIGQTLARSEGRLPDIADVLKPLELSERFHKKVSRPGWKRLLDRFRGL